MSTTLTRGTDVITPDLVLGYSSSSPARAIVHTILGASEPDVTDRPAGLRTGTLSILMTSEADSLEAELWLQGGGIWTLASTDRTSMDMTFVVVGDPERELEDATRALWILSFGWQEVSA